MRPTRLLTLSSTQNVLERGARAVRRCACVYGFWVSINNITDYNLQGKIPRKAGPRVQKEEISVYDEGTLHLPFFDLTPGGLGSRRFSVDKATLQ